MKLAENEKVFLQEGNVTVSQSRFSLGEKEYEIRNISSVTNRKIEKSRKCPKILIVLSLLLLINENSRILGIVLGLIGVVWLFLIKDEYSVRIQSKSGAEDSLISKDEEFIEKIIYAIDDAMICKA